MSTASRSTSSGIFTFSLFLSSSRLISDPPARSDLVSTQKHLRFARSNCFRWRSGLDLQAFNETEMSWAPHGGWWFVQWMAYGFFLLDSEDSVENDDFNGTSADVRNGSCDRDDGGRYDDNGDGSREDSGSRT